MAVHVDDKFHFHLMNLSCIYLIADQCLEGGSAHLFSLFLNGPFKIELGPLKSRFQTCKGSMDPIHMERGANTGLQMQIIQ